MDETIRAVLLFLGGGVMLEIVRQFGKRNDFAAADTITQRGEWRQEVEYLRQEVRAQRLELDEKNDIIANLQKENADCLAIQRVHSMQISELRERLAKLEKKP